RRTVARDVVTNGSLKHFVPSNKLYVYQRKLDNREITVILNGTSDNVTVDMSRYAEILRPGSVLTDVITGNKVAISPEMTFTPRQILVLQNF
ncbi:MAG: cyclomaltodextrinase C-terminal domain-containing protein, partial [Muribaculaceae bacterium]|nr:cyclomaltodextrinase C-terminal domain-containing protein [Muribaculaceae bacterium]